jgi:hypothetical protein
MAQISPEEMAALAAQAARGQTRTSTGPTSQLQQKIFGTTTQEEPVDPTWMGKTADFLTEGAGFWPYMVALGAKGVGINPAPDAPSFFKIGSTLKKHVPTLTKNLLKRNPYSGVGLALLPGALNLGEWGYQGLFGDDPAEADERLGQAGRAFRDEGLALGGIGLARRGVGALRNLSRGLRETIPSVTGAGARAAEAAEEAARAAPAPDVTRPRPVSTKQQGPLPDVTDPNTWSSTTTDTWNPKSTTRKPPPTPTDGATTRRTGDAVDDPQMKLPFDQPRVKGASYYQDVWGQRAKRYDKVRSIPTSQPIFVDVKGPARTPEAQTIIYNKPGSLTDLQFPGIQRITNVDDPGQMVGRLQQILIEDGVTNIDDVVEMLRQDQPNKKVLGWVIPRLDNRLKNRLSPREWSTLLNEMGKPTTVTKLKDVLE